MLGLLHRDSEWLPDPPVPGPAVYHGAAGFAEFMRVRTEDFVDWTIDSEKALDAGDTGVVVLAHQRATGKASGTPVDLHFGQIYEFTDGRVSRVRNFLDPTDALRAAGLRE